MNSKYWFIKTANVLMMVSCLSIPYLSAGQPAKISKKKIRKSVEYYIHNKMEKNNGHYLFEDKKQKKTYILKFKEVTREILALSDNKYSVCACFYTVEDDPIPVVLDFLVQEREGRIVLKRVKIQTYDGKVKYTYKKKPGKRIIAENDKDDEDDQNVEKNPDQDIVNDIMMQTYEWESELDKTGIQATENIELGGAAACPT
ncbi:MAG: hypothetical protein ABII23_03570 [bacterium]